jgi:hypothetical protein
VQDGYVLEFKQVNSATEFLPPPEHVTPIFLDALDYPVQPRASKASKLKRRTSQVREWLLDDVLSLPLKPLEPMQIPSCSAAFIRLII